MNSLTTIDLADLARQSLVTEVTLAPKPGLVDPFSNGAHADMDHRLFMTSIEALTPFLSRYVASGRQAETLPDLFATLRRCGAAGEAAMLRATRQVNTHKGANFSYAVLLGALGWCLRTNSLAELQATNFEAVFSSVQTMTAGITAADFAHVRTKSRLSYGEELYVKYGILGVRGEAEAGYPALTGIALPFLATHQQLEPEYRYLQLMVYLIAQLEDGNVLHRGGQSGLRRVKAYAQRLVEREWTDENQFYAALERFDRQLIAWHLSPGGTADLLALSIFFDQLNQIH